VELIRWAKAQGIPVTAENRAPLFHPDRRRGQGLPHRSQMNPPLGNQADLEAVRAGLADETIDAVATGPCPPFGAGKKRSSSIRPPLASWGWKQRVPLTLALVRSPGVLSLMKAVACLTAAPARILGVPGGSLAAGQAADLTIIDPDRRWTVEAARFKTLGRNTPFEGAAMTGCAVLTMVQGRITHNIL
jgi:dihydroorotase